MNYLEKEKSDASVNDIMLSINTIVLTICLIKTTLFLLCYLQRPSSRKSRNRANQRAVENEIPVSTERDSDGTCKSLSRDRCLCGAL